MTTAEAAAKWAEAKEARERAREALSIAQEAYKAADAADMEAWKVLSELSGRVAGTADFARMAGAQMAANQHAMAAQQTTHYSFDDGFLR